MQPQPQSHTDTAGRSEYKYRIRIDEYLALRNALRPHMRMDRFTRAAPGKGYLVRSLYYETPADTLYAQKEAGDSARVKYRLRAYTDTPACAPPIRVEMKVRRGELLFKHSVFVPHEAYAGFIQTNQWAEMSDPVLEEFAHGVRRLSLAPYVLIDYHREGYASRYRDGLRVTFDHGVSSAHAKELFPERHHFFRTHHEREIVLEIKFPGVLPEWFRPLVCAFGLRQVANSKFSQGVEVGRRDRVYLDGVVVVR